MVEEMTCIISFDGDGSYPFEIGNVFVINGDIYAVESDLKTKPITKDHHDITLKKVWKNEI
jgi:hypothetical protein